MDAENRKDEPVYEAPRVEHVLTSDELVREVQYAGNGNSEVTDLG